MRNVNWDNIEESTEGFSNPTPGGYIAVITKVQDCENKEYLRIEWEFAEGPFKGSNSETYKRAGFWPTVLYRSYKEKALGFFKAFKICVEQSNPGYTFNTAAPEKLVGKAVGVVLGEEGYCKANGTIGKRLYVAATRSIEAIRAEDYEVPEFKPYIPAGPSPASYAPAWANDAGLDEDDPF